MSSAVEVLQGPPDVPERGEVEPEGDQDEVGLAEDDPLLLAVGVVEVGDDEGEAGPGQQQGLGDPLGRDQGDVVEVVGGREQARRPSRA